MDKFLIKAAIIILFFPLATLAQSSYTEAVNKIGQVLFDNSREKQDLDAGYKYYKDKCPNYIVRPLEILIPTVMVANQGKFELRYSHEF